MHNFEHVFKYISGHFVSILLRVVGYTAIGITINTILAIVQWEAISSLFSPGPILEAKGKALLLFSSVLLFPIGFFILGQKQALIDALSKLLKTKKYDMVFWLVDSINDKYPDLFKVDSTVSTTSLKVVEYTTEIIRDLPSFIVKILQFFIDRIGFNEKFAKALNEIRLESSDHIKVEHVSHVISNMIPGDVIQSDIKLPLALCGVNIWLMFI